MFLDRTSGICASCGKSLVCTYSRDKDHPFASCEEFDGFAMTRPTSRVVSPQAHSWVAAEEETYSGGPGLCGTCRKQSECGGTEKADCGDYR